MENRTEIQGAVLEPGTYVFKLSPSHSDDEFSTKSATSVVFRRTVCRDAARRPVARITGTSPDASVHGHDLIASSPHFSVGIRIFCAPQWLYSFVPSEALNVPPRTSRVCRAIQPANCARRAARLAQPFLKQRSDIDRPPGGYASPQSSPLMAGAMLCDNEPPRIPPLRYLPPAPVELTKKIPIS